MEWVFIFLVHGWGEGFPRQHSFTQIKTLSECLMKETSQPSLQNAIDLIIGVDGPETWRECLSKDKQGTELLHKD